jgi:Protein of unknown function (DUF3300)
VHILDETLVNGGFVRWIADNFWPTYHVRMFFWFNAAFIGAIAISSRIRRACDTLIWINPAQVNGVQVAQMFRAADRASRATLVGIVALMSSLYSSNAAPQPVPATGASPLTAEQLDQLVAPIALYPDPLVAQILMAATYPLEVVEVDRWLQTPANAALKGDALTAVLQQHPWDPSIKSLAPFPQLLRVMDSNLQWTEQLGDAFLAQQADVMDAVQRLRQRAQAAGSLASTPQQTVSTEDQEITIEPEDVPVRKGLLGLDWARPQAELERRRGQAWQYQQTRRSLSARLVYDRCARRHPLRQNPWHQASALAYSVADAATHKGRCHRACQQDRKNGVGDHGQGRTRRTGGVNEITPGIRRDVKVGRANST